MTLCLNIRNDYQAHIGRSDKGNSLNSSALNKMTSDQAISSTLTFCTLSSQSRPAFCLLSCFAINIFGSSYKVVQHFSIPLELHVKFLSICSLDLHLRRKYFIIDRKKKIVLFSIVYIVISDHPECVFQVFICVKTVTELVPNIQGKTILL